MRRLSWVSVMVCSLFFSLSAKAALEVHGHRGARGLRPENTLPAFEFALQSGADVLELDLGVSKDEKLVITHDLIINTALCSGSPAVPVHSLTSAQISLLDCGSKPNPRFPKQVLVPGTPMPTLDQFFDWIKKNPNPRAREVRFNIETKIEAARPELAPTPARFSALLVETLKRHGMLERTVVQSFDFRTLQEARKLVPGVQLSALFESRPADPYHLGLLGAAKKLGVQIVSPNHEWLSARDVRQLQAAGIKVIPWTANTVADFKRLKKIGVDGIITDYPDRLITFLKN